MCDFNPSLIRINYIFKCVLWTYPLAAPQNTHHRHKWFHKFVCRKIARDECRSIFQFDAINEMEVLNVYSFVCFILFFRIISTIKSCNIDAFFWSASEASKQKMKWNDYKQVWEWWKKIICPIRMRYLQSIYFSALSLIQFSSKMKCCVYEWVSEWMSDSVCSFFVVLRKRWDASSMHVCVFVRLIHICSVCNMGTPRFITLFTCITNEDALNAGKMLKYQNVKSLTAFGC